MKKEKINLKKYSDFVKQMTSDESEQTFHLYNRLLELKKHNINPTLLLNSAIGLASEGGELSEIVKKCTFQGKELNSDTIFHLKRELGDIAFYWMNCCRALNLDPNDVMFENINKLKARYPNGKFDKTHSENRKKNDL